MARKRNWMKSLPILIVAASLTLPVLAAEPGEPLRDKTMPTELIGVWSDSNPEGRKQCAAYRKDPVPRGDHDPLAGSVLISATLIQTRAKSGVDEYYKPDWVSRTARATWLIRSNYYSGALPGDSDGREPEAYMADTMALKGKTLVWSGPETSTRKLFRCGDLVE
jgi:hypothetical protein